jgi:hypothetical protein
MGKNEKLVPPLWWDCFQTIFSDFHEVEQEYTQLYSETPSPGEPIPIHYVATPVDDSVPGNDEITAAVEALKNGKSPGPSGLRAEDIQL